MIEVELKGVWKELGGRNVLRGMTLRVPRGQTTCLIGGSGTGKSVSLKHMVGLMQPDRGEVLIDGVDIGRFSEKQLTPIRRRLGVLFQSGALINWMTVFDNVALPLVELTKMKKKEIRSRVMEKLNMLGLGHAPDLMPAEISGGMRKRVALARAIIWDPELILYDEPTSGLDPVIAATINNMIVDMHEQLGVTQVVVTHDMESAYTVGHQICMLYQGRVLETGTPDEIRATKNPYVRQFIEGNAEGPITGQGGGDLSKFYADPGDEDD